jgi:hypothetical protein
MHLESHKRKGPDPYSSGRSADPDPYKMLWVWNAGFKNIKWWWWLGGGGGGVNVGQRPDSRKETSPAKLPHRSPALPQYQNQPTNTMEVNLDARYRTYSQGCGSGFSRVSGSGSGSRRAKMTHKRRKKFVKVHALKCWMASLRAEGFFCNLDILYGGLGIGK